MTRVSHDEMAQATKPENLSLILRTHMVETQNQLPNVL